MPVLQYKAEVLEIGLPLNPVAAVGVLVVFLKDGFFQGVAEEEVAMGARAAEGLIAANERMSPKVVVDKHVLA